MHAQETVDRALTMASSGVHERDRARDRYGFTNVSEDIKGILGEHLDLLGIAWRRANARNIAMTRRSAVARLDEFVGPRR